MYKANLSKSFSIIHNRDQAHVRLELKGVKINYWILKRLTDYLNKTISPRVNYPYIAFEDIIGSEMRYRDFTLYSSQEKRDDGTLKDTIDLLFLFKPSTPFKKIDLWSDMIIRKMIDLEKPMRRVILQTGIDGLNIMGKEISIEDFVLKLDEVFKPLCVRYKIRINHQGTHVKVIPVDNYSRKRISKKRYYKSLKFNNNFIDDKWFESDLVYSSYNNCVLINIP